LINGIPYQKGQYEISPLSDETQIKIVRVGSDTVLTKAALVDWVDAGGSPFADFAAFVLYTEPFFFRSVAGGGGGSVNSVTGDGVGGTATDVVLTFPTSNQVDNDSLIPGATTTDSLNELGVATSDNATAIVDNTIDIGTNATNIGTNASNISTNASNITTLQTNNTGVNTGDETTLSIQTKRPLKTVNLQSLEGVGDISISGFDPAAEGVLTDYIDSQNNNTQTSNATQPNLATYLTLVTTGVDIASFYRFEVSFSVSHDATNSNAIVDIKDFGVSILPQVYTVEPKDNSNRTWVTLSGKILPNPLGAGQVQLQLDFGTDDAADDTTMYFANISLQKIN
jgi:hypothetical protein